MRSTPVRVVATLAAAVALSGGGASHAETSGEFDSAVEVHVTTLEHRSLERHLTLYGEIVPEPATAARPAGEAKLASATGGWVTSVHVVEGQGIDRGAIVVQLDSREADAALERARAETTQATAEAQRQKRLAEHEDSSAKQRELAELRLAEARATLAEAQTARDLLDIRAPLDGTVLRVGVRPGEVVDPGQVLVEMVDLERLIAEVRVPAIELSKVQVGQSAVVQAAGTEVDGRVVYVGSRVDPAGGTAPARIQLASPRGLHPGEFARARLVVESSPDALAVPARALVYAPDGAVTVTVVENGRARLRTVETGIEDGDWVEIDGEGIRAGIRIVSREAYGLPDDTPVRAVEESTTP